MPRIPLFDSYTLRPICTEDTPDIFDSIDSQREYLGRWLPFVAATLREEQTQQVVEGMLSDTQNPVFTLRDGETFAGLIGFKCADPITHTVEIGYWMRCEQQGKGLMTAAVEALCTLAFESMGMEQVTIRCAVGNRPSNHIPQRLGFRLDCIEVRSEELSGGEWADLNVYRLNRPKP